MPKATLSAVTVDTRVLDERLTRIARDEMPFVRMLSINELAQDTIRIEKLEMQHVFDRPKPFTLGGLRMLKKAKKKESPQVAVIGFSDLTGRFGGRTEAIVRTHIEGDARGSKGHEKAFRSQGVIGRNDFLVAGQNAPKDRYGNIAQKWYGEALAAFRRGKNARQSYPWILGTTRNGDRAIYRARNVGKRGRRGSKLILYWIIERGRPDYRKRFDFYGEAQRHATKFAGVFAQRAIRKAQLTAR